MPVEPRIEHIHKLCNRYRVSDCKNFRLADWDPSDIADFDAEDKPRSKELLQLGVAMLAEMQEMLFLQDRWAVLLIFQAMDAAGKDGVIKHVMSGVNPAGCDVHAFKPPSTEELDHDFLWRTAKRIPVRGRIGIFNRSYYEEVLVVKVHPELLKPQKLPESLVTRSIWRERYEDIRNYEHYLSRNGIVVRKFFLHLSPEEQKRRFLERLDRPDKHWKFSPSDITERAHWGAYMAAYEEMIRNTHTDYAPWHVIPADNKWFTRMVVAAEIIDTLAELNLRIPKLDDAMKAEMDKAREALRSEK